MVMSTAPLIRLDGLRAHLLERTNHSDLEDFEATVRRLLFLLPFRRTKVNLQEAYRARLAVALVDVLVGLVHLSEVFGIDLETAAEEQVRTPNDRPTVSTDDVSPARDLS